MRLDCRSLEYYYFPFDSAAYHLVLCNLGVKHRLASSKYNTRCRECEEGVARLRQHYSEIKSLCDVTLPLLEAQRAEPGGVPPLPLRGAGKPARSSRL